MRTHLSCAAILVLLLVAPAHAQVITSTPGPQQTTTGTTCTTQALAVSAGDLLITTISVRQNTAVDTVVGAVNGAFAPAAASTNAGGVSVRGAIYYRQNATAGTEQVTVTLSGTITSGLICDLHRVTSMATSSVLDQVNTNDNVAATSHSHGSITTTGAGVIVTSCAASGSTTETVAPGFTPFADGGFRYWAQSRVVGSSTTTTGAWTSSGAINTGCAIASFNLAAAAAARPSGLLLFGVGGAAR